MIRLDIENVSRLLSLLDSPEVDIYLNDPFMGTIFCDPRVGCSVIRAIRWYDQSVDIPVQIYLSRPEDVKRKLKRALAGLAYTSVNFHLHSIYILDYIDDVFQQTNDVRKIAETLVKPHDLPQDVLVRKGIEENITLVEDECDPVPLPLSLLEPIVPTLWREYGADILITLSVSSFIEGMDSNSPFRMVRWFKESIKTITPNIRISTLHIERWVPLFMKVLGYSKEFVHPNILEEHMREFPNLYAYLTISLLNSGIDFRTFFTEVYLKARYGDESAEYMIRLFYLLKSLDGHKEIKPPENMFSRSEENLRIWGIVVKHTVRYTSNNLSSIESIYDILRRHYGHKSIEKIFSSAVGQDLSTKNKGQLIFLASSLLNDEVYYDRDDEIIM